MSSNNVNVDGTYELRNLFVSKFVELSYFRTCRV